jgi:hypothetical protein
MSSQELLDACENTTAAHQRLLAIAEPGPTKAEAINQLGEARDELTRARLAVDALLARIAREQ